MALFAPRSSRDNDKKIIQKAFLCLCLGKEYLENEILC